MNAADAKKLGVDSSATYLILRTYIKYGNLCADESSEIDAYTEMLLDETVF